MYPQSVIIQFILYIFWLYMPINSVSIQSGSDNVSSINPRKAKRKDFARLEDHGIGTAGTRM